MDILVYRFPMHGALGVFFVSLQKKKNNAGNFNLCTKLMQTSLVYLPDVME